MTTAWITKAQHALETGQPKLAELYMRRGLGESPEGKAWLARHDNGIALRRVAAELEAAGRKFTDALVNAIRIFSCEQPPPLKLRYEPPVLNLAPGYNFSHYRAEQMMAARIPESTLRTIRHLGAL